MAFLEAILIAIGVLVASVLMLAYMLYAYQIASDRNQYANKWMRRRSWLGVAMLTAPMVIALAFVIYTLREFVW